MAIKVSRLEPGDKSPTFSLANQDNSSVTSKELLTRIDGRDAAAAEHVARLLFAALIGIPDHRRGMWS